jgi:hypothetical protein
MRTNRWLSTGSVVTALLFVAGCRQPTATSPSGSSPAINLAIAPDLAVNNVSTGVVHSVVGSGEVSYFGVSFRSSVAARSDEAGNAWGEVSVPLNLTGVGLGRTTFSGKVNCLAVDGPNAWVGFVITHSTNDTIIPSGASAIVLVRDLGGPGQDVTDGELFPSEVQCTDRPTGFVETVVLNGNYTVR